MTGRVSGLEACFALMADCDDQDSIVRLVVLVERYESGSSL